MTFKVDGVATLSYLLSSVEEKHVKPLHRATLLGIAAAIRDKARTNAPRRSDSKKIRRGKSEKFRTAGNLKKSISAKSLKPRIGKPDSAIVFVRAGTKQKYDGYYWRFVEHGAKTKSGGRSRANPFLARSINSVSGQIDNIIATKFTAAFERRMRNELKRQAARS